MTQSDHRWSAAEAKANFAELVRSASSAPQRIENRGRAVAVVLSAEEYQRLADGAARASTPARLEAFIALSAELRLDLDLPERASRPSPFETVRAPGAKARRSR